MFEEYNANIASSLRINYRAWNTTVLETFLQNQMQTEIKKKIHKSKRSSLNPSNKHIFLDIVYQGSWLWFQNLLNLMISVRMGSERTHYSGRPHLWGRVTQVIRGTLWTRSHSEICGRWDEVSLKFYVFLRPGRVRKW